MQFTATKPTINRVLANQMLTALSTIPGAVLIGTTPKVHLLSSTITLTPDTPIATMTAAEATFTGYVAPTLPALSAAINLTTSLVGVQANLMFIEAAPATVVNTLFGYYVTFGAAAGWSWAELFPFPFPLVLAGDFLDLQLLMPGGMQFPAF